MGRKEPFRQGRLEHEAAVKAQADATAAVLESPVTAGGGVRGNVEGDASSTPPPDAWDIAWAATLESNSALRAKGLHAVCELLLSGYKADEVLEMQDRIQDTACSILTAKKSDKVAEVAVTRLLSIALVTLGRDCQELLDAVAEPLQARCKAGRAQGACTTAFAMGAFCAESSDHERLAALRFLAGQWLTTRGADLVASLRAWSLMLTAVDVRTLSAPLIEAFLQHLARMLSGSNVALRSAAAEALGLLYHVCGLEVLPDDDDELLPLGDGDDDEDAADVGARASLDASSCAVNSEAREALECGFQRILERLEELAENKCALDA